MALVQLVRRDGQIREAEVRLDHRRGNVTHIHARVAPLTSRLVVVLADDRTHVERVEAIRRDFVANVSHELKTPIGALNLLAEAVEEAKDDPDAVVRFAGRMQSESLRLTRLVQQIIDLSRLQNDAVSEEAAIVKVEELVAEATEHSATEAERKRIEIATSIEPELFVHGDRIFELSTKCAPSEAFDAAAEARAFLSDHGIDLAVDQQTKTRTALQFFAGELEGGR